PNDVCPRDLPTIGALRDPAVQANHRRTHHRGVEVNRNEEGDEVHDREADVEEPEPEDVRGRGEEQDRDEEAKPDGPRDQEGQEWQEDEPFLLAKDAEADLRELPADAKAFEEAELPRDGGIRCRRYRRGGRPHRNRGPIRDV